VPGSQTDMQALLAALKDMILLEVKAEINAAKMEILEGWCWWWFCSRCCCSRCCCFCSY
jgi:hypothetical protein